MSKVNPWSLFHVFEIVHSCGFYSSSPQTASAALGSTDNLPYPHPFLESLPPLSLKLPTLCSPPLSLSLTSLSHSSCTNMWVLAWSLSSVPIMLTLSSALGSSPPSSTAVFRWSSNQSLGSKSLEHKLVPVFQPSLQIWISLAAINSLCPKLLLFLPISPQSSHRFYTFLNILPQHFNKVFDLPFPTPSHQAKEILCLFHVSISLIFEQALISKNIYILKHFIHMSISDDYCVLRYPEDHGEITGEPLYILNV